MGKNLLSKIKITSQKIIKSSKGDVLRVLKKGDLKNWNLYLEIFTLKTLRIYDSKLIYENTKCWCRLMDAIEISFEFNCS